MPDTAPSVIAQDAPLLYRLLRGIIFALLRILTKLDIEGMEHVPRSGPLIAAPNHIHLLDSVLAFGLIPRRVTVFAADKWRIPPIGCLLSVIGGAIYVARGEADRRALAKAIAVLRAGGVLGVAPEGTRSHIGACSTERTERSILPAGPAPSSFPWQPGARRKCSVAGPASGAQPSTCALQNPSACPKGRSGRGLRS